MSAEIISTLGSLIGVVIGALLAWFVSIRELASRRKGRADELRFLLMGELTRISRHYRFVAAELPPPQLVLMPRYPYELAKYGPIRTLDQGLIELGFLEVKLIEGLFELSFLIRNLDILFQAASDEIAGERSRLKVDLGFIEDTRARAAEIAKRAEELASAYGMSSRSAAK